MEIIAKHLDRANLKIPIYQIDTVCAFTGLEITEGVKIFDLVSDVFTDWEYVKYPSGYASIDLAMCVSDTIKGKTRNNSLRNYSYFASNDELRILNRQDILDLILNIPSIPFRIAVSFNQKKHTTYKTALNNDNDTFVITTDLYNVVFERSHVDKFLSIIQNWYSIVDGKQASTMQPTYFTKDEILKGNAQYAKQIVYGLDKFEQEN